MPPCARCVRANGRDAARICSWRWFPNSSEHFGAKSLLHCYCMQPAALCSRPHTSRGPDIARDTVHGARLRNAPFVDTGDPYKSRHRHRHERPAVLRASALALRRLSSRTQPAPVCAHTQRRKNAKHRAHRPPAESAWPDCAQLPPFLEQLRPASDGRVPHRPAGM